MSFYTALTGLNAATAQLGVTSNNIANVGTSGFKRSRADFGDIFATSPLQKASSVVGQGVALKQVSQEFSQGNIQFSANALDLAITGDGFFPLKSADGLQDIYTRNGAFTMNDQYNVVNSAGQALLAASVDSSGKADLGNLNRLSIPNKTTGEAQQTEQIELGLNFPADAQVITDPFNRANPATYNKTTALTVYDQGGNGYLATVYYVKTQNASQLSPTNKWQTFVYIGDTKVNASLIAAKNDNNESLYVNKYGELKPESELAGLVGGNVKTQMFHLDDLTDRRTSSPASATGNGTTQTTLLTAKSGGIDLSTLTNSEQAQLSNMFSVDIDGSGSPVQVDLSELISAGTFITGADIAKLMTNQLNSKLGDEKNFDMSTDGLFTLRFDDTYSAEIDMTTSLQRVENVVFSDATAAGSVTFGGVTVAVTAADTAATIATNVSAALAASTYITGTVGRSVVDNGDGSFTITYATADENTVPDDGVASDVTGTSVAKQTVHDYYDPSASSVENTVDAMQRKLDSLLDGTGYAVTVGYDRAEKVFTFVEDAGATITLAGGTVAAPDSDDVMGLTSTETTVSETGYYTPTTDVTPNGSSIRNSADQRFGIRVTFDNTTEKFTIASGTTGDDSSLAISNVSTLASTLLGFTEKTVAPSTDAVRGISSNPAMTKGSSIGVNVNNNFSVEPGPEQKFIVTVDDVSGEVYMPASSTYTLESFKAELEKRINLLADSSGRTVSGVKVGYDSSTNSFNFTTGTASSDSFIKVTASSKWGLSNAAAGRGQTSTWTKPTQFTEQVDGNAVPMYVDGTGKETSSADGFTTLPAWSPVFLDKGELTFDTSGKLVSPKSGAQLDTVYLADGKGSLRININYSRSTQFSSPFAVLSQSQDGKPEGDLIGVNIGDDGLVNASYSNGSQKSLGKVILVNFSNPNGLRQIGDSSFYSTSSSGTPKLGEAGGAGFGTIRAGARERANVDLTQELVDLITAQRNFQASAKAIETSTSLTQSIINIRN